MVNNRQTESVQSQISRTNTTKNYVQIVHTAPARIFLEKYLTKKGRALMALAKTKEERDLIRGKYEKNRYVDNPDCRPFIDPKTGKKRKIHHT